MAAKKYPATYTALDILYYDGEDVTGRSLMERKKLLAKAFKENERLALSRHIEEHGTALYELAKAQNLEGIVAKRIDSLYKINSRTKDWIKIKNLKDEDFVICGYIVKSDGGVTSLILGAYRDGHLVRQGHVTLGVSRREFDVIARQPRSVSPFDISEDGAVYLEPALVCTVKYMERNKNGGLRQPVFKGLRADKEAAECVL
jgi:bifunctional non-homologous end joining protein LigD/DNA ligase-1